jgi:hypothetical protein
MKATHVAVAAKDPNTTNIPAAPGVPISPTFSNSYWREAIPLGVNTSLKAKGESRQVQAYPLVKLDFISSLERQIYPVEKMQGSRMMIFSCEQ